MSKRENAMSDGSGAYRAEDLRNLRSLPDNNEFSIVFDEKRKLMRRTRKPGSDDQSAAAEQTRARCSLERARLEDEKLRINICRRR